MSKQIGSVLAREFREICKDSNTRVKTDFSKISDSEIEQLSELLKKVDRDTFDFEKELKKLLKITDE
ncbi:MAG: hypothetical protein ACTSW1_10210 [Candidatus Hodarchaeales archaeon]